ncbi:hypothetical protein [Halalkalibaculum sp. DA384]|uniref:hypothetical protein n=1 Tax=Halalkalibaculum sp. DA384 TaxID=3373606 RepID=UPI0037550F5A
MDVLTGQLPSTGKAVVSVIEQDSDAPGDPGEHTLYPFGYGLSYEPGLFTNNIH